jgi:hypothetical protein
LAQMRSEIPTAGDRGAKCHAQGDKRESLKTPVNLGVCSLLSCRRKRQRDERSGRDGKRSPFFRGSERAAMERLPSRPQCEPQVHVLPCFPSPRRWRLPQEVFRGSSR